MKRRGRIVPMRLQPRLRFIAPRLPTAPWRAEPAFFVAGTQRGGTTSLFAALSARPDVLPPPLKELHHFSHPAPWPHLAYRAYFPLERSMRRQEELLGRRVITGEGTPNYLFDPAVPARIHRVLPEAKIIVLLREPVGRAWSQFQLNAQRASSQELTFREAAAPGAGVTSGPYRRRDHWENPRGRKMLFERGLYAEQLERWFALFAREQLLLVRSEDWYADGQAVLSSVCAFLGIESSPDAVVPHLNQSPPSEPDPDDREWLAELYREPNERLRELTGVSWAEDRPTG